jgi:hypothetical protein
MTDQTDTEQLDGALPESSRTVLLAGPPTDRLRALCTTLHRADAETDVLVVTYTREPSDYLADLDGETVGDVIVVSVGDTAPGGDEEGTTTRQVDAPADLTQLGIEIGDVIDGRERVSVCFDSLTTTLQYADYTEVYEFLHAITGRLRAADARTHVHINPIAHDDQVLAGLSTLFDARVEVAGESLSVDARPLLTDGRNV